ncbi:helix-turn-helix domain-containing protein [Tangfeifania diversioriginum]|uniref:helix-turn-helix domain-containing protein n=1 Tax=Tangfeifania diversioriginum TaxID=1168035 RepID=UPI000932ECDC
MCVYFNASASLRNNNSNPEEFNNCRPGIISSKIIDEFKENEYYLDPDISLQELAGKLNISKHKLSKIIKDEGYDNFYVLINHFRIQKSKILLSKMPNNHVIESVVTESGFKSRSTFYRVFKDSTGLTPKEYICNYELSKAGAPELCKPTFRLK